jgi:hypothetical protein
VISFVNQGKAKDKISRWKRLFTNDFFEYIYRMRLNYLESQNFESGSLEKHPEQRLVENLLK